MHGELIGIIRFIESYGSAVLFILFVLAGLGTTYVVIKIKKIIEDFNHMVSTLMMLHVAHKDPDGNLIILHGHHERSKARILSIKETLEDFTKMAKEHFDLALKHYEDVERLSSDEHWKNCPVDKCPNFTKLLLTHQESTAIQDRLVDDVERMSEAQSALALEMIAVLRMEKEAKSNGQK